MGHTGRYWKTLSSYSTVLFEVRHMYIIMLVWTDQRASHNRSEWWMRLCDNTCYMHWGKAYCTERASRIVMLTLEFSIMTFYITDVREMSCDLGVIYGIWMRSIGRVYSVWMYKWSQKYQNVCIVTRAAVLLTMIIYQWKHLVFLQLHRRRCLL